MNNEKHNKKEKAKEIAKKILHVICYILSALFILLMSIVGLQNCKKTSGVSAQSDAYTYYVYKAPDTAISLDYDLTFGDYAQYYSYLYETLEQFDINLPPSSGATHYKYQVLNEDSYIEFVVDGNVYGANNIEADYYYDGSYWWLSYVSLIQKNVSPSLNYTRVYDWILTNINNGLHVGYSRGTFKCSTLIHAPVFFQAIEHDLNNEKFAFNKDFNFNAPLGISKDGGYAIVADGNDNIAYWHTLSTKNVGGTNFPTSGYYEYNVGFTSNGMHFKGFRAYYGLTFDYIIASNGDGTTKAIPTPDTIYLVYFNIRYIKDDDSEFIVNRRNRQVYTTENSITRYLLLNSTTWENDAFRLLTFDAPISDALKVAIQSFNNNNQGEYAGVFYDDNTMNVFTLVASAFSGLLPILNVMILPNITIGILLFIPLVAMLVFTIIRIVKK